MAFDLERIVEELAQTSQLSPWPAFTKIDGRHVPDVAVAVIDDTFRLAARPPLPRRDWEGRRRRGHQLWEEQVGMLAHVLASTSARAETVAALQAGERGPDSVLDRFFDAVKPLGAEMVRSNRFRREEFLRNWVAAVEGEVEGESRKESRRKLEQLDYAKALEEYKRAEAARKAEAKKRAETLRQAREQEAQARGWRE